MVPYRTEPLDDVRHPLRAVLGMGDHGYRTCLVDDVAEFALPSASSNPNGDDASLLASQQRDV